MQPFSFYLNMFIEKTLVGLLLYIILCNSSRCIVRSPHNFLTTRKFPQNFSSSLYFRSTRSSHRKEVFCKKGVFMLAVCNFIKKETLTQVYSCEFCLMSATLLKKRHQHRCFPVNFAKFLRTSFFKEHLRRLLLNYKDF